MIPLRFIVPLLLLVGGGATQVSRVPEATQATACPVCPGIEPAKPAEKPFQLADWSDLPGWGADDMTAAFDGFASACKNLAKRDMWSSICAATRDADRKNLRGWFEVWFRPWQLANADGSRFLSWVYCRRRSVRRDGAGRPAGAEIRGWSLLYVWARTPAGDRTDVLFPLWWKLRRPGRWSLDLAFPLYGRYRDDHTALTAGLPFWHAQSKDQDTWGVLYLYWRDRQRERRRDPLGAWSAPGARGADRRGNSAGRSIDIFPR